MTQFGHVITPSVEREINNYEPWWSKTSRKVQFDQVIKPGISKSNSIYICICVPKDVDIRFIRVIPFWGGWYHHPTCKVIVANIEKLDRFCSVP